MVERTVVGGRCLNPGPSVRVPFLDSGSWSVDISSPGNKIVVMFEFVDVSGGYGRGEVEGLPGDNSAIVIGPLRTG